MDSFELLVTGGAGFIGSNFIRYALRTHSDWQIVNLDKLTYAGNLANLADIAKDPRYTFVRGDIADREQVNELFARRKFDAVIHFAAETHVDRSIFDAAPFLDTNVKGTQVLLEAARKYGVERFVHISTDEVYGSLGEEGRFTEESPLRPSSPYAASKAAADLLCQAYHKTYNLPVVITRSCNNYGPCQFPEKLIPLMIYRALEAKPLPVYGDGRNMRDWLYVEDHCLALNLVLRKGVIGEIYNISGGCEKRNIEIVEFILEKLDKPKSLIQFVKDRPGHDWRYALDASKLQRELGWKPCYDLEPGLQKTIEWYLEHGDWVEQVTSGEYQAYYERVYSR